MGMCQGYRHNGVITRWVSRGWRIQTLNSHRFVTKTDRPLRDDTLLLNKKHELNGGLALGRVASGKYAKPAMIVMEVHQGSGRPLE